MNREKRRKFVKEARTKGIPDEYIDAYLTMLSGKEIHDDIKEDEKVMVNVERVVSSKNYAPNFVLTNLHNSALSLSTTSILNSLLKFEEITFPK